MSHVLFLIPINPFSLSPTLHNIQIDIPPYATNHCLKQNPCPYPYKHCLVMAEFPYPYTIACNHHSKHCYRPSWILYSIDDFKFAIFVESGGSWFTVSYQTKKGYRIRRLQEQKQLCENTSPNLKKYLKCFYNICFFKKNL